MRLHAVSDVDFGHRSLPEPDYSAWRMGRGARLWVSPCLWSGRTSPRALLKHEQGGRQRVERLPQLAVAHVDTRTGLDAGAVAIDAEGARAQVARAHVDHARVAILLVFIDDDDGERLTGPGRSKHAGGVVGRAPARRRRRDLGAHRGVAEGAALSV